jgi:predicted RNase H-like nuclease (RuvC/YqgF family)
VAESLDNILSGKSETVPEPEEKIEAPAQEQEQPTEQPQEGEQPGQQKMVPHEALHAEKQKVKRYTEQIASFEQTLKQRDEAWDRRFGTLLERLTPQQQQPQEPIDWYADPDKAFNQGLAKAVTPLEQKFSTLETQIMRLTAVQQYGADKVTAFESYVSEALQKGDPEMGVLSAQMRASPDPVGVGLKWFEKRTFDPEAERKRIRDEIEAELKTQPTNQPPPVMPSNLAGARNVGSRSGPPWAGPTPLADILASRK